MNGSSTSYYIPISPALLVHDSGRQFDTFLRMGSSNRHILYAKHGSLTKKHKDLLLEREIDCLYIRKEDRAAYDEYVQQNYGKILLDDGIPLDERSKIFYEQSNFIISSVFSNKLPRSVLDCALHKKLATIIQHNLDFIAAHNDSFKSIGKLIDHNYKTYSHSVNVNIYAVCLLQQLGFEKQIILDVSMGALLHDIGKTSIPNSILDKPESLTPEEFEIIKTHSARGVAAAQDLPMRQVTLNCILFHHEKLDGSGYPTGLTEEDIPPYCRAVTIADIYDAITSKRAYNEPSTPFEALKTIVRDVERNKLDKETFKCFVEILSGAKLTT